VIAAKKADGPKRKIAGLVIEGGVARHGHEVTQDGAVVGHVTSGTYGPTVDKNIALAYNVHRTALEEGVRRVVVCSSNHAADYYERLIWAGKMEMVTPDMPPRSDNWYGWAKAAYELLGFVFATGKVDGKKQEVVEWRIGGPRDDADLGQIKPGDLKVMHRGLGAYFSKRDQVQEAIRMVEAENIADEHGVPFLIVYGISGNTHRFWSLANARAKIGYEPEDDSQVNFADKIAAIARAAKR